MTRINLVKYGFVRWPEEDFSDDGNRFQVYKVGRVRVTKLVSDGYAYFDGSINDGKLPYDVYSKLPHYKDIGRLNGEPISVITEDDIQKLYEDCQAYDIEYTNAEKSIVYPTLDEIIDKASRITNHRMLELSKIENRLNRNMREAITEFSTYEWKQLHEYFNNLVRATRNFDIATYPQTIVGQSFSFTFVKPTYEMGVSYWFQCLNELFDKYNLD